MWRWNLRGICDNENGWNSRRRDFRGWLSRFGLRSRTCEQFAHDFHAPTQGVTDILSRTADELRKLSDDVDAWPIVSRASEELTKLGCRSSPAQEAAIQRYLKELPEQDYEILSHHKAGMKHFEIAALMDLKTESVLKSLVKTYSDLRIRMMGPSGDDGDGMPVDPAYRRTSTGAVRRSFGVSPHRGSYQ